MYKEYNNRSDPMPTFQDFRSCHKDNTDLYVRFISELVMSVRGIRKDDSCFLADMENFESVDLTYDTEAFTLFIIADKEEVWQEMIQENTTNGPLPRPKYTLSKQFKKKRYSTNNRGSYTL